MVSLHASGAAASVRRRRAPQAKLLARALVSMCDVCGRPVRGGAVLFGPVAYCSIECAQSARDRFVAGNYLG